MMCAARCLAAAEADRDGSCGAQCRVDEQRRSAASALRAGPPALAPLSYLPGCLPPAPAQGKELIEDLTVLRFANLVFEPLWSRQYIRNVQARAAGQCPLVVMHAAEPSRSVGGEEGWPWPGLF